MKTRILLLTLAALPWSLLAADVTGTWKSEFDSQIGVQKYTFTFKQDGTNLTGTANSEINDQKHEVALKEGKVVGDKISFVETLNFNDNEIRITYTGTIAANEIKFHRQVGDFATEDIVAKREGAAAAAKTDQPASAAASDVTGTWKSEFDSGIGQQKYTFTFKQDGAKLTGKANSEANDQKREAELQEGKVDGDKISFVEMLKFQDNEIRITYTGTIQGNEIKLHRQVGDIATEDIVAKREGAAPASAKP